MTAIHFRPIPFIGVIIAAALLLLLAALAPATFAAPNPSGTGQPGAECGEENALTEPAGFLSDGFAHAETVYAGSGASANQPSSEHAVSQYDVACFQLSSR